MTDLSDKWIWITGASSGIGKALAELYDKRHANLILSARNVGKLQEVKNSCSGKGQKYVLPIDLANYTEMKSAVEKAYAITDKIDILINNGGVSQRSFALETDIEVTKRLMDVNFMGTVALTMEVVPAMVASGSGQLVVVSSVVGKYGSPYRSSYSASKHALHGFFDSLRLEVENKGIQVTIICPGFVSTNISYNALIGDGSYLNTMDEKSQNGLSPEDFARKAVKAIDGKKREVYIGKIEVLGVYLKRYFPALFRYVIKRSKVR